jgi:DNA invertase Pin-like site-specific DNA recombinase
VVDLAGIVQKLEIKKVDLVVLDQGIDTTTMYGRLQFNILVSHPLQAAPFSWPSWAF